MTDFASAAAEYLATRRAMGYKFDHGPLVGQFATYLDEVGAEHLTIAHALTWAKQPAAATPAWCAARLSTARGFARYLSAFDPATEVPPVGLLPAPNHRAAGPYIYSEEDVARVREAAGRLRPEHRADTYQTLIALVAVTGMRAGEPVRLDCDDVDFEEGLVTIRNTKFGKSRQLPLHQSTVEALAAYAERRDQSRPKAQFPSFFTSSTGTRLLRANVSSVFARLVREAGLGSTNRSRPPRLHDLRHSFAVKTMISWYRRGLDVEQRLPLLSTWLGHSSPRDTYWYLSAVPELLELVVDRVEAGAVGP